MSEPTAPAPRPPRRSDDRSGDLALRLRRAGARELQALVAGHGAELNVREVRQTLLNPHVTPPVIEELAAIRRLLVSYEVRCALARHRRTPETLALRFVAGLFWRDLIEIAADVRLSPAVRRVAEKYLLQRLGRLTVGERIAAARRASPAVLAQLRHDPSRRVIAALLDNPRLTEEGVLPLAASAAAPPRILALVAGHPRWGPRYAVRTALSRNPHTPARAVLEILPGLHRRDLAAVAAIDAHAWIVRHQARELLAARRGRPTGDGAEDGSETDEVSVI